MTPDLQTLFIAALFASQIYVLSFYTPTRWRQYHMHLCERYPRDEYPRLHPLSAEELERKFRIFKPMHLVIGAGAILVLFGAVFQGTSPRGLAGLMQMCLFVQLLLPLYIALPLEVRIRKGLSSMPPPSPRSVELRKWRVTDFISSLWIGLGIAAQVVCFAGVVAVYLYRPETKSIFLSAVFMGAMLVVSVLALFGEAMVKRPDPYMSPADTFHARQRNYRGLFLGGAALAIWQTSTILFNAGLFQLNFVHGFMLFSVVAQLSGLVLVSRRERDLSTRDFSVYRADGIAQVAR
jgi:hypothetical protein